MNTIPPPFYLALLFKIVIFYIKISSLLDKNTPPPLISAMLFSTLIFVIVMFFKIVKNKAAPC